MQAVATAHSVPSWRIKAISAIVFAAVLVPGSPAPAGQTQPQGSKTLQYNQSIRPILAENCFTCHGPDSAARKADLRLDRREQAVKVKAIVPGDPRASEIIRRISSHDPDEMMPPPATKKTITPAQREALTRWIQEGAEYQKHWSLIPPTQRQPPVVKNTAWLRNPIDRFVLAKLEEHGLAPAAEADRRTLARRLSLDLTGLPPEPAEVAAFVNDRSPDAYEKLVDHFLDSLQWGEHRGRYWLDAARYADSNGIHFDNYRENWAFRDWVINAFNRNMPFDRFTVEQLAGDLLPNRTLDQQVASAFNRCNITTNEGGAISEEYLVLYTRDRTETTSQVWLGLTAGCAVCHDHKFDPLPTKEFYSLAAFFNNTTQAAMDGNVQNTPPVAVVPRAADRSEWDSLQRSESEIRRKAAERRHGGNAKFDAWQAAITPASIAELVPRQGLVLDLPLDEGKGNSLGLMAKEGHRQLSLSDANWVDSKPGPRALKLAPGQSVAVPDAGDFEGNQPFSCSAWLRFPRPNMLGTILARFDDENSNRGWEIRLQKNQISANLVHTRSNSLRVVAKKRVSDNGWHHVALCYDGSRKAAGLQLFLDGAVQETDVSVNKLSRTIRTKAPFTIGRRSTSGRLPELEIRHVKLFDRQLTRLDVARLAQIDRIAEIAALPAPKRTPADQEKLLDFWMTNFDPVAKDLANRLQAFQQAEQRIKLTGTVAHVMQERDEAPAAFVLVRGAYDRRSDRVTPATPAALPPMPPELPRTRLGFAKWLMRRENPLTARVTVNRFWQEVFGTGIVRTTGDFGVTGELPSHPELLDWLAIDFRDSGWDVKRFFKQLVTSAAYRQSAQTTPLKLENDPQNRLLSRGPRFRMDAEMVRDYALAASGLLVRKLGGPSVRPYQPPGVWEAVAMIGSNTRDYKPDTGDKLYRRSLYTFWKRAAPPALLDIFNAPSREVCTVRRERTNTPLQALATLNDPTFVESARHLAQTALHEGGPSDEARAGFMAERLLARPLVHEETALVTASLADLSRYYASHVDDAKQLVSVGESRPDPALAPATLAAWTMLANEMMNLDEVLNK